MVTIRERFLFSSEIRLMLLAVKWPVSAFPIEIFPPCERKHYITIITIFMVTQKMSENGVRSQWLDGCLPLFESQH